MFCQNKISGLAFSIMALTSAIYLPLSYAEDKAPNILKIERIIDENQNGNATSCAILNDSLEQSPNLIFLKNFVEVLSQNKEKQIQVSPFVKENKLCLSNLKFGKDYTLVLKKGFTSSHNFTLKEDLNIPFRTIDEKENISFSHGMVLSQDDNAITVKSVNMKSFKLSLFRISMSSLPGVKLNYLLEENLQRYEVAPLLENHGEYLGSKVYTVKDAPNQEILTTVKLSDFTSSLTKGLYMAVLTKDDDNNGKTFYDLAPDYDAFNLNKLLIITNLGVTTYRGNDGLNVAVRNLDDAKALSNAKVTLLTVGNEVLGETITSQDGYAHFDEKLLEGNNARQPAILLINHQEDVFALDLRSSPLFLEDASKDLDFQPKYDRGILKGQLISNKYNVYAYTNRTMLRPGETVMYEAHIRDQELKAAGLDALVLNIVKPNYSVLKKVTLKNNGDGVFSYEHTFSENDVLGDYRFELGFDENEVLCTDEVTLSSFKPATINGRFLNDSLLYDNTALKILCNYNFGAPAQGLYVDGYYLLKPCNHPVQKYADYYFGTNTQEEVTLTQNVSISSEATDANGVFSYPLTLSEQRYPQKIIFNINVNDPGSNNYFLSKEYLVPFSAPMIGLKKLPQTSEKTSFELIASTTDGNLVEDEADYVILRRNISYQYVMVDDSWQFIKNEYLSPVSSGTVSIKTDLKSNIISENLNFGSYVINLKSQKNGFETSYNFYVGCSGDYDANTPDRFELLTDKKIYNKDDEVRLQFESLYDGYADLVLGTSGVENISHYSIKKGHNEITFKLNEKRLYGTYALLSTYASEKDYVGSRRAIGLAYLKFDNKEVALSLTPELPEVVKPNAPLEFKVKVNNADSGTEAADTYVTAMIVDNGILSINKQKAPDLLNAMTGKRALSTQIIDMYNHLITDPKKTGQGYGDEMLSLESNAALSNITKKLLSLYSTRVPAKDGYATFKFDMPNLATSCKLMLVASSKDRIGSYSTDFTVRDKAVVKLNAPYYLHALDSIQGALYINNLEMDNGEFNYEISCSGDVTCALNGKVKVDNQKDISLPLMFDAQKAGEGTALIKVSGPNFSYEDNYEIKVLDNAYPVMENHLLSLKPQEQKEILLKQNFEDGAKATATFGAMPFIDYKTLINSTVFDCKYDFYNEVAKGFMVLYALDLYEDKKSQEYLSLQKNLSDILDYLCAHINKYGHLFDYNFNDYEDTQYATIYAGSLLLKGHQKGFYISDSILEGIDKALKRNLSNANKTVSALTYLVSSEHDLNVKSEITYRFDHESFESIDALCSYANAFQIYKDERRAKEAVTLAQKRLFELLKVRKALTLAKNDKERSKLYSQIQQYEPLYMHTLTYDVMHVVETTLRILPNYNLSLILDKIDYDSLYSQYLDDFTKSLMVKMHHDFKTSETKQETLVKDSRINLKNPENTNLLATASVLGKVKGPILHDETLNLHVDYYDTLGNVLNLNEALAPDTNIIMVVTLNSSMTSNADLFVNCMLPANTMYLSNLRANDELLPKFLKNMQLTNGDVQTIATDTNIVTKSYLGAQKTVFAYLLKTTYKGKSAPLMVKATTKTLQQKTVYYTDPLGISVK